MFEDLIKLPRTAEVLGRYGMEVRNGYQDKLIEHNRIASGRLLNSIEFFTEIDDTTYEVYLRLEDYWKYVENDTVPHMPPVNKILEWVRVKPVLPRPKDGRLPTPEGLAWAIARTIEKEGTEGTHDLEQTLEVVNARYFVLITEALAEDLAFAVKAELELLVRPYSNSNPSE